VAAYAFVFHHSLPSLAHPLGPDLTWTLSSVFSGAVGLSFLAYLLVGVAVSLSFGDHTLSPANLNWEGYKGVDNMITAWSMC